MIVSLFATGLDWLIAILLAELVISFVLLLRKGFEYLQ